ncbi:MAG TPA: hypothetical protein VMR52_01125 [Dehalococcoidia bacterium]|nr:hypothetical protein [Dehalococcoidia bacterium]
MAQQLIRFLRKLLGYPPQFSRTDGELTADLSRAFVVAHNAGDHLPASRAAIDHHADIVEIDLIARGDKLLVAHPRNAWIFSRIGISALDPEEAWAVASAVPAVKLDLKEASPQFVRLVLDFLAGREATLTLIVTYSGSVITEFEHQAPWVIRSLSVSPQSLARLRDDEPLLRILDGISAAPSTFTSETISWARDRGLFTMSSVVNTFAQADRLLHAGVNGIITDNLALIEAIGHHADTLPLLRPT